MEPEPSARAARWLRTFMLCAEHLDPGDPDFVRVCVLNGIIFLLGGAGAAFAVFNAAWLGPVAGASLILFDLSALIAAVGIGVYLWRSHDIERSAAIADVASLVALLGLVIVREGGEYFELWAMLYPPIAFMLRGPAVGARHVALFLGVLFVVALAGLGEWNHGHLDAVALSNLVGATLALTGLVAAYEGSRRQAHWRITSIRRELERISIRDALTGVYNRRFFSEVFPREMSRASRGDRRTALLLLDADHFKAYNDAFGHPAGDRVLIALAGALSAVFRRGEDLVFRVGGEEFAVLCQVADEDDAMQRAEAARGAVERLAIPAPHASASVVTVSAGVGILDGIREDPDAAYARVDRALYEAKRGGRNRCVAAPPAAAGEVGGR
jgi:diguanylate cyclase (GGDEF)-like protein